MRNELRRSWVRWLAGKRLPLPHVAAVLGIDETEAQQYLARRKHESLADAAEEIRRLRELGWTTAALGKKYGVHRCTIWCLLNRPAPAEHSPPDFPHAKHPSSRAVLGPTGRKIRILTELGYSPPRVAELLMLELALVRDFIGRLKRIREHTGPGEFRTKPRTKAEACAASRGINRTRRRRARQRRAAAWGRPGDCIAAERAEFLAIPSMAAVARADAVRAEELHRIELAELLRPPVNPWVGSVELSNGRTKLTKDDVGEIRRLRAEGWSYESLAQKFGTAQHTIYKILTGRSHKHV